MESADVKARKERPQPLVDAPRWSQRWRYRIVLALVLLVPFFVPIPRALQNDPIWAGLGDRVHVLLMGGATLFLYWYGPLRGRLLSAASAALVLGGVIELAQKLVGRHALWHDVVQDLIGIGIVVGLVLWIGRRFWPGLVLAIALLLLIPWQMQHIPHIVAAKNRCAERFPLLDDFEAPGAGWLWSEDYEAWIARRKAGDGHGWILRVETPPSNGYPAAIMGRFPSDWSAYENLVAEVRLVEGAADTVKGGIVVTDYAGYRANLWNQMNFHATDEWRTVALPLQHRKLGRTGRELDLTDVFSLKIYLSRPTVRTVLEIDNVRLE